MTHPICDQLNYGVIHCRIQDHALIQVSGKDAENFLQGQLSNDIKKLAAGRSQLTTRLSLQGRVQGFFSLGKWQGSFYLFMAGFLADKLLAELARYIITEDVHFTLLRSGEFSVTTGAMAGLSHGQIPVYYLGFQGYLAQASSLSSLYQQSELGPAIIYTGFPVWGKTVREGELINETILGRYGISYAKGCFFGQETPAKINSGRGANYFPCLVKIVQGTVDKTIFSSSLHTCGKRIGEVVDGLIKDNILYCRIKRSHRILGQNISLEIAGKSFLGQLVKFPAFGYMDDRQLSHHLFLRGSQLYQKKNHVTQAIDFLRVALQWDDKNADAYEALGVILGHQQQYDEAIAVMDKLSQVDPSSVMAYTNRSLFFMKKGDIPRAEQEKAQATVLGMRLAGQKAKLKRQQAVDSREQQEQRTKRIRMYQQVLAIDPQDSFAHYSLAAIYFEQREMTKSAEHAQKALDYNSKYSGAYLLLGKVLVERGQRVQALTVFSEGKAVASAQGKLAEANEMQQRWAQLTQGKQDIPAP